MDTPHRPAFTADRVLAGGWLVPAGAVVIGTLASSQNRTFDTGLAAALVAPSLVAWCISVFLVDGACRSAALAAAAVSASAAVVVSPLVLIVIFVAVITYAAFRHRRAWQLIAVVTAGVIAATTTVHAAGSSPALAFATISLLIVAALIGVTRRQSLIAQALADEAERERTHSRVLADRSALARDLHDVLAHSLGGLVIQLGAAGALLDAGRADEAADRVARARVLAVDGLRDARTAVDALRSHGTEGMQMSLETLETLVDTHRSLGFTANVTGTLDLADVGTASRDALVRVLQEALNNARRHAPSSAATITLDRDGSSVRLRITTLLDRDRAPSEIGGGNGLHGMHERFAALGGEARLLAGRCDSEYIVDALVARKETLE